MARWLAFDAANQSFVSYDSRREAREAVREQPDLRFSERVNSLARRQQVIPDYTTYYYVSRYASTEEGRTLGKQTMEAIQLYGYDYDGQYSYEEVPPDIDMSEAVRAGFIRYRRKGK